MLPDSDERRGAYAIITAARDEVENLPGLARSITCQSHRPARWIVVDNGSTDGTPELVEALRAEHDWIRLLQIPGESRATRAAPVVRAFEAGLAALDVSVDYVANQDADVTFAAGYFAALIDAFGADPSLGIAGGVCFERQDGSWCRRFVTGTTVWGGSRLYRWRCLADILPLEPRLGWDGMAEAKANMSGWTTRLLPDLPFLHHRPEGSRDSSPWAARAAEGRSAHYMGYRPWYLALRAGRHSVRTLSGLGLIWGYALAAFRREQTCPDPRIREYVRRQQHPANLSKRFREAIGRVTG